MKAIILEHFETELRQAQTAIATKDFESAWTALQRAHILAQAYPFSHAIVHWRMLKLAWKQRNLKEVAEQVIPTSVAVPLTLLFGRKRRLRDGKANSSDSKRKFIPNDLLQILNRDS